MGATFSLQADAGCSSVTRHSNHQSHPHHELRNKTMAVSEQVYSALQAAAHKIANNNYKSQLAAHVKAGRNKKTFRFQVSEAHAMLCKAMGSWDMDDNSAMCLLHYGDVWQERFPDRPK
jgi:hypothetical protein